MAQKTAVEWLDEKLIELDVEFQTDIITSKEIYWNRRKEILEQAKQMEKEQIENAVIYGLDEDGHTGDWKINVARKYYNDTYKNQ